MNKISWIHFSDLHMTNGRAVDTILMRRELPQYINGLNRSFDYAFCTGDLKEWNGEFTTDIDDYLKELCEASHTNLAHLFIVPGNHDVDVSDSKLRTFTKKWRFSKGLIYRWTRRMVSP